MKNGQEKKKVEDLTAVEALNELQTIFNNIPNPFNGSILQVESNIKGVKILFEKINESIK